MFAKIFGNVSKESIKRQKTCRGFTAKNKKWGTAVPRMFNQLKTNNTTNLKQLLTL